MSVFYISRLSKEINIFHLKFKRSNTVNTQRSRIKFDQRKKKEEKISDFFDHRLFHDSNPSDHLIHMLNNFDCAELFPCVQQKKIRSVFDTVFSKLTNQLYKIFASDFSMLQTQLNPSFFFIDLQPTQAQGLILYLYSIAV